MDFRRLIRHFSPNDGTAAAWLFRHSWVVVFPVTLLWFGAFAPLSIDLHHDGVMLKPALDAAAGLVPFRDSFNQYGVLSAYLPAAAIRLFGGELLTIKLLTVLFYALSAVWLDRLWRRVLSPPARTANWLLFLSLAPFLQVVMHPWSSVYALFFMLVGGDALADFAERGRLRALAGAGAAAAVTFGFRQPCGIVLFAAALLLLAAAQWQRRPDGRRAAAEWNTLLAAALLPVAGMFAALTAAGAFADYRLQCFTYTAAFGWERGGAGRIGQILQTFWPPDSVYWMFPAAGLGLFAVAARRLIRRSGDPRGALTLAALALVGLASWHQYYPVPCVRHLYWGAAPLFGALCWWGDRIAGCRRLPTAARAVLILLLAAWPLAAAGLRLHDGFARLAGIAARRSVAIPGLRGMLLIEPEARYYERFAAAVAALPPELRARPFLNRTPDALFSLLMPRPGMRPMFVDWGRGVYPDYPEQAADFVRRHRPTVLSPEPSPYPGYRPLAGFPRHNPRYYLSLPPF